MADWLQHNEENTDVEQEWDNIENILQKTAEESLRKVKVLHKRRYLKIWDNEIKKVIEEKKIAYRRWWNIKSIPDKKNYKQLTVIANRETRKRKGLHGRNVHNRWNMTLASQNQTFTKFWNILTKTSENLEM